VKHKAALIIATLCAATVSTNALADDVDVHAGDKLMVHVYNHPELSGPRAVDTAGNLTLPLAGQVAVAGSAPSAAADRIRTALAAYLRSPAVDVQVISQGDTIFVAGGPGGTLKYAPGATLATVLASLPPTDGTDIAHGRVDLRHVRLRRGTQELGPFDVAQLSASGTAGPALQPGDTIVLENKPIAVAVRGNVKTPGSAYLATDEPLGDAIVQAGGLLPGAATGHVALQRGGNVQYLTIGDDIMQKPATANDVLTVSPALHVTVTGSVATPGNAELKSNFSLISALYSAGGPQKNADLNAVHVVHDGQEKTYNLTAVLHGDTSQNPTLTEGDLVAVPEGRKKLDVGTIFQDLVSSIWLLK
jgi:protein involved in polysaccharide export with SLBB domain